MSNINKNKQISNVEQCMSSSLMSEKLDKKHMVNFSSGNQKNIKVSWIIFNSNFKLL